MNKNATFNPKQEAQRIIAITIEALQMLTIDETFVTALTIVANTTNNIYFFGVGKSGIIGKKLAATFASLGMPAFFMHPTEALHGDMGRITSGDVVIAISHSGSTTELIEALLPLKKRSIHTIAITGNIDSALAHMCTVALNTSITKEACPWNTVPTTSLVTAMVLGDALALCLAQIKGITQKDFAYNHPKGALGARLQSTAADSMHTDVPHVYETASLQEALIVLNTYKLGAVFITNAEGILVGILTDGDIRRLIVQNGLVLEKSVTQYMTNNPITGTAEMTAGNILDIMEKKAITTLAICSEDGMLTGVLHIHDILGRGTVQFNAIQ